MGARPVKSIAQDAGDWEQRYRRVLDTGVPRASTPVRT
jgi:hypothetical protein